MSDIFGYANEPVKIAQGKAVALGEKSPLLKVLAEETNASGQVALPGDPKLVQRVLKRQTLSNRQKALQARFMPKSKANLYKQQRLMENYLAFNKLPTPLTEKEERNVRRRRLYGWAGNAAPSLTAERKEGEEQLQQVIANKGRFRKGSALRFKNNNKTSKYVRAAESLNPRARFPLKLKQNRKTRRNTRRNLR